MTDMITAEEAEKLLDGTTPGLTDHCLYHCGKRVAECPCMRDLAAKHALATAAPDLARTVIALHAQLADAEAAMAAVVERAAEIARIRAEQHADMALEGEPENARLREAMEAAFTEMRWAIRALAPACGLALVRKLRADADRLNRWRAEEGEKIKRQAKALTDLTKHCQRIEAENAGLARKIGKVQRGDGDHSQIADLEAKVINQRNELANLRARDGRLAELAVERDTLAAANSMLEARVAGLRAAFRVNMLRFGPPGTSHEEIDAAIDAALSHIKRGKTNG